MSLLGVLATILVVLKMAKLVAWSWWWVLAPVWVPLFIVGFIAAAIAIARLTGPPSDAL